ncbi:hypothetical protein T459_03980 [Capsicum annuum]|uniref:Uncharacterized protein n=1 Tax=Capsicum annuum TaxID=4072 RepID=A0A2G3APE0_CAPAN|nr:hypothetical protein T459_03980 [Capsicum annuum]
MQATKRMQVEMIWFKCFFVGVGRCKDDEVSILSAAPVQAYVARTLQKVMGHVSVSFAGYVDARIHTEDTTTASTKNKKKKASKKKGKKGKKGKKAIQKPNASTPSKPRIRSINTAGNKIVMKLDVKNAHWLSERVRERIILMENDFPMAMQEESRIKDGELVLTSTKTRKQELKSALENNFEDVVAKKQKVLGKFQEIINAASYAPLPPSDGLVKKISKL